MASLSGLLYYYTFDGTDPLTNLVTGTNLTLTGTGVTASSAAYKTGTKSIYNSAVSNTGNYNTAINGSTAFSGNACTISLWFNPSAITTSGRLIRLSNAVGVCAGISLYGSGTNVGISYDISGNQSTFSSTSSDKFGISSNTWSHIAITYSVVAGTTYIGVYLNGTMIQNPTTSTTYSFLGSTLTNLYLFGFGTVNPMVGYIDEVMVFNRALSKNEVMNLYNFNYLSAGQTTLFQSVYGSSTTVADTFVASGGISTTGTITTNNNNINAGLGTINAGSLNLVNTSSPATSGGFNPTMAGTGVLTCGAIVAGPSVVLSFDCSSPVDIDVSGNFLYILFASFQMVKYNLSTNASTIITLSRRYLIRMVAYKDSIYFAAEPNILFKIDANGTETYPFSTEYGIYIMGGLCEYNDNLYIGVQNNNTCILAYNFSTNQPLVGFTKPALPTGACQMVHLSAFNNVIYAADLLNNRISTFNATTGAIIKLDLITGLTNVSAVETDGSALYVACNNNVILTYSLNGVYISTFLAISNGGVKGIRMCNNLLYVTSTTSVKSYSIGSGAITSGPITTNNNAINAGTGTVTCSTITSTTNTISTNNNAINAGSGAVNCGSINCAPTITFNATMSFVVNSSADDFYENSTILYAMKQNSIYKYNLSSSPPTQNGYITNTAGISFERIAGYGNKLYGVERNFILVFDTTNSSAQLGTRCTIEKFGYAVCAYNGILYVGVSDPNNKCLRAYDTNQSYVNNQPLVELSTSVFIPPVVSYCFIRHITVFNNIIYAADSATGRIRTFNATTGAIINLNLITGLTNVTAVETDGAFLYVAHNGNAISGYLLNGFSIVQNLITISEGGLQGIRMYGNKLYVSSTHKFYSYIITNSGGAVGTVSCGSITTNNNAINAGTGVLTCGKININAYTGIYWGFGGSKIYDDGDLTVSSDNFVDILLNNNTGIDGKFRVFSVDKNTWGSLQCGQITTTGTGYHQIGLVKLGTDVIQYGGVSVYGGSSTLALGSHYSSQGGLGEVDYVSVTTAGKPGGHHFFKCTSGDNSTFNLADIKCAGVYCNYFNCGGDTIHGGTAYFYSGTRYFHNGNYGNGFKFYWNGNRAYIIVDGNASFDIGGYPSDYRIKRNITSQNVPALSRIMKIRPVVYQLADYGTLFKSREDIMEGFIAQELQEIIPSAVDGEKNVKDSIKSLRLDALCSVLTKGIQEIVEQNEDQQTQIDTLKSTVSSQQSQIDSLTQQLAELKSLVQTLIP